MKDERYNLYKGVQSPLVFKGFKGKYIYWGMGAIVLGVIIGSLSAIILGSVLGMGILAIYLVIAFGIIFQKQKKGLYSRNRESNTIFLIKNNMK